VGLNVRHAGLFVTGLLERKFLVYYCLLLLMKSSELLRLIKKAGWYELRQSGSHIILRHQDYEENLVFPNHGAKEISKGIAEKLKKQAGIK
jgi:predicted RNA binding protein YcfA (HicA-like mRNA interferase family)